MVHVIKYHGSHFRGAETWLIIVEVCLKNITGSPCRGAETRGPSNNITGSHCRGVPQIISPDLSVSRRKYLIIDWLNSTALAQQQLK